MSCRRAKLARSSRQSLLNLLKLQGVEVHAADKDVETKDGKFEAGSYVVRMDQPYSRMADMLLDTQYYNINDPRPYDDTGWTLGPLHNVKTVRVKDVAILDAPMTLTNGPIKRRARSRERAAGFVVNHTGESADRSAQISFEGCKVLVGRGTVQDRRQEF